MPLYAADLGTSGLADVGVTEIQDDKTNVVARTQTGVTELGSTGVYYREWTLNSATALLLWDSAATPNTVRAVGPATERDIDSILSDTNAILLDTGTDGVVISAATGQAIADELLKRDVSNTEDSAGAHSLTTIVLASLESALSGTTWTIKKTDGVTTFVSKTVTVDATADPVTSVS